MIYAPMTVDALIAKLETMPSAAPLKGLSAEADSYRGYYNHVAIEPGAGTTAGELAEHLRRKLGTTMHGYKGGDYTFGGDCYVFVAEYGSTGYSLAGFTDEGEPVLLEDVYF